MEVNGKEIFYSILWHISWDRTWTEYFQKSFHSLKSILNEIIYSLDELLKSCSSSGLSRLSYQILPYQLETFLSSPLVVELLNSFYGFLVVSTIWRVQSFSIYEEPHWWPLAKIVLNIIPEKTSSRLDIASVNSRISLSHVTVCTKIA